MPIQARELSILYKLNFELHIKIKDKLIKRLLFQNFYENFAFL